MSADETRDASAGTDDDPQIAELIAKGMSYRDLDDALGGLSVYMKVFGIEKADHRRVADAVAQIRANEAKVRGIAEQEVLDSPPETMLSADSVRIFAAACEALDKTGDY